VSVVDISSNKNERQKLRMWRKKMEDQNTASVDSSLNKIKDKNIISMGFSSKENQRQKIMSGFFFKQK
jgi:hypothetical protein